jgi:hypothetical protein
MLMEHAATIFEAELVEVPKRAGILKSEIVAPLDLVVRRRDDGSEVVRTPAELETPSILLATVENDLRTMTVDEFMAEWKMPGNR